MLKKAFLWTFGGRIIDQTITFFVSIILARLVEPEEFGLIAVVLAVIVISQIFVNFGLGSALMREKYISEELKSSVFYFNLMFGMVLCIILFFAANYFSTFYGEPELFSISRALSVLFVVNASYITQNALLMRKMEAGKITGTRIVSGLVGGIVGIILASYDFGVWSLVYMRITSDTLYAIIIWQVAKWRPMWFFSLKQLKEILPFSFFQFLDGLLATIFNQLDVLLIGKIFTMNTLGYFGRAKSLNQTVVTLTSESSQKVLFPYLSGLKDKKEIKDVFLKSLEISVFFSTVLAGYMYLVSDELVIILFGEKWKPSADYYEILSIAGFTFPTAAVFRALILSTGHAKENFKLSLIKKVIRLFTFLIAFFYGIIYFLISMVLVFILGLILDVFQIGKLTHVSSKPIFSILLKYTLIMTILSFSMKNLVPWQFDYLISFGLKSGLFLLFIASVSAIDGFRVFKKIKSLN